MRERDNMMVAIYIHETMVLIDQLEEIIIQAEIKREIKSSIDDIFRIMHTLKGNAMMMGYNDMGNLGHAIEDLFDFLRNKKFRLDDYTRIINIVLESIDYFKEELKKIEENQEDQLKAAQESIDEINEYLDSLKKVVSHRRTIESQKEKELLEIIPQNLFYMNIRFPKDSQMEEVRAFAIIFEFERFQKNMICFPDELENTRSREMIRENGFSILINTSQSMEFFEEKLKSNFHIESYEIKAIDLEEFHKIFLNDGIDDINKSLLKNKTEEIEFISQRQKFVNIRVDYLDQLLDLVGEMVIAESIVSKAIVSESSVSEDTLKSFRNLRETIEELQNLVMEIRMVPMKMTFQKMNRIVRDMRLKTGKKIIFDMIGEDILVDKNIIENISDPLMHLIRNAVDHGIENATDRINSNKNSEGHIILKVRKAGGDIFISVSDDGKGLDIHKIYKKAIERGLLTESFESYTEEEIFEVIFEPGFSTNSEVTSFSGRGVGLDVVKNDIDAIGGILKIDTEVNVGTTFTIKIPMTLTSINGMTLRVGGQKFILPVSAIVDSFSASDAVWVEKSGDGSIILQEEVLNNINLSHIYDIKTNEISMNERDIVVIEAEKGRGWLFVDEILGEQQMIMKNFKKYTQKIQGVAGAALLEDGELCFILDPQDLLMDIENLEI